MGRTQAHGSLFLPLITLKKVQMIRSLRRNSLKAPLRRIMHELTITNSMVCKTSIESSNDAPPPSESSCL
jgi:hypothetical protein